MFKEAKKGRMGRPRAEKGVCADLQNGNRRLKGHVGFARAIYRKTLFETLRVKLTGARIGKPPQR